MKNKLLVDQVALNATQQDIILRTEFQELSTEALVDILDLIEEAISHYELIKLRRVAKKEDNL